MSIDASENIAKASHVFWFKIKALHTILEFVVNYVDFNDSNDNNSDLWDLIVTKVEDFFSWIMSESIIINIVDQRNNSIERKNEIWCNYELLIDNLSKLLLSKEYNIIYNYEDFFDNIKTLLIFFENILTESFLHGI